MLINFPDWTHYQLWYIAICHYHVRKIILLLFRTFAVCVCVSYLMAPSCLSLFYFCLTVIIFLWDRVVFFCLFSIWHFAFLYLAVRLQKRVETWGINPSTISRGCNHHFKASVSSECYVLITQMEKFIGYFKSSFSVYSVFNTVIVKYFLATFPTLTISYRTSHSWRRPVKAYMVHGISSWIDFDSSAPWRWITVYTSI